MEAASDVRAESYVYTALSGEHEIRVLELLPGYFDDELRGRLHHTILPADGQAAQHRAAEAGSRDPSLEENLPHDWQVHETIDGRYVFRQRRDSHPMGNTAWAHPVTGVVPDPCVCTQRVVAQPPYEALSYVWGEPGGSYTIRFGENDVSSGPSALTITRNLDMALRHLRYEHESRMTWVDAVCINQGDNAERSQQVRNMGEVYSFAWRVIIWLGPEADESSLAMKQIQHIGGQILETKMIPAVASRFLDAPDRADRTHPLPLELEPSDAIHALVRRPWFDRVWVWQESAVANHFTIVQCGHAQVTRLTFHCALALMIGASRPPTTGYLPCKSCLVKAEEIVIADTMLSFLETLLALTKKQCRDPRDKVYGALGITGRTLASLRPDYNAPVADVYKSAFLLYLRGGRSDFLAVCNLDRRNLTDGATWVPDLSVPIPIRRHPLKRYHASGDSAAAGKYHPDEDALEVAGVSCGTICRSSVMDPPGLRSPATVHTLQQWRLLCPSGDMYVTGEDMTRAFTRTLRCENISYLGDEMDNHAPLLESKDIVEEILRKPGAGVIADERLVDTLRSFMVLESGYIGITDAVVQEGDLVFVVLGCLQPLILRRSSQSEGYQVVGSAYMHGLMNAERLLGPLEPTWKVGLVPANNQLQTLYKQTGKRGLTDIDPRLPSNHLGVYCDGPFCSEQGGKSSIQGIRWKCMTCPDTDFCASCRRLPEDHRCFKHPIMPIKFPIRGTFIVSEQDRQRTEGCVKVSIQGGFVIHVNGETWSSTGPRKRRDFNPIRTEYFDCLNAWRNDESGQMIRGDPRLSETALLARGVNVERIRLV